MPDPIGDEFQSPPSQALISVVIPTYNRADDVVKAVESVSRQTHQNLEIIVVVDGSKDSTVEQLKKLQATEPRLQIIEQENQGVSVDRNRGIHEAKGEYIALLDDDDLAAPRRLEVQLNELQKAPKGVATLCTTNMEWVHKDGTRRVQEYSEPITAKTIYANNTFIPPTSWFASKETFKQVGDFDVNMKAAEDFDWLLRHAKNGGNFVYSQEPLVTYFVPDRSKIYPSHAEGVQMLLDKHSDVLGQQAITYLKGEVVRADSLVQQPHQQRPPYTPKPRALGEDRPFYNTTVDLVLARERLAKISPAALERFEDILYRMDSKPSMFDRNAIGRVVSAVKEGTETYNTDRVWESVHMGFARVGTGDAFKNQLANDIRQLQYDISAFDASPPSNPAQTGFESNGQAVRARPGESGTSPPTAPMQMALPPGTAAPEIIGAYETSVLRAREALKNSAFPDAAERFDKILLKVERAPAEARPALREAMAALAEDSVRGEWKNSTNLQLLEALRLLRPKGKFTEPPLADDVRRFQSSLQVIAMDARDNGGLAAKKPVLRTEATGSVQIISAGQEEPEITQAREALLKSGYPTISRQFDAILTQVNGAISDEARPAFRKAIAELAHNSASGKSSWTVDERFHESILSLAPGDIGAAFDTPLGEAMHELRQNLKTVRDRVKAGAPGEKLSIERSSQSQSQKESDVQVTLHEQGIGDPSQPGPFGKGGPLHRIQLAQPEGAYDRGYVPPPKTAPSTPIIADTVKTASSKPIAAPMQSTAPASETAPSVPVPAHEISAPVKPAIGATETWNPRMQGMNSKIGTAAIVINLADAALKKDPRKAAEVGGTALAMHAGMKVAGKVVGEVVGGIFAGKDAYDAAKSGHTTRAAISGIEATLYTVSATAGAATLADCWNPTVIAPAAVALVAGGAAVTITAAKGVYDNWNTVKGWFGHHEENHDTPTSKPAPAAAALPNKPTKENIGALKTEMSKNTPPAKSPAAPQPPQNRNMAALKSNPVMTAPV